MLPFLKTNPIIPKPIFRGERSIEYQFLFCPNKNPYELNQHLNFGIPVPVESPRPINNATVESPRPIHNSTEPQYATKDAQENLIVYTRRPREPKEHVVEQVTNAANNHESFPGTQGNS